MGDRAGAPSRFQVGAARFAAEHPDPYRAAAPILCGWIDIEVQFGQLHYNCRCHLEVLARDHPRVESLIRRVSFDRSRNPGALSLGLGSGKERKLEDEARAELTKRELAKREDYLFDNVYQAVARQALQVLLMDGSRDVSITGPVHL